MADNKVLIEFQIVQKGKNISVVQKETDKLRKSQDKLADSQKKSTKQQEIGYGRQKQGLIQTANSTKNFSKLANTIDGGGGGTSLVGAYATLAANIFAATAAFGALSRAAEFQQLQQGLDIIGSQSGRSLGVLAQNLRDATEGALTLEQASRGAALGISGGFGARELEGLAKIAKGASLTLGRDLADAFDRLTRGAIKLEPEILDELGIMVRLDDAVESYAAALGKPATALSQLERRQAFMNAILEQGELKFGEIADAVDPTPYQKLGAAFGDLTKDFFNFINEGLQLNSVVEFLSNNILALVGVVVAFGSTIATQMIPALGNQAMVSRQAAAAAADMADDAVRAADDILDASRAAFLAFEGGAGNFKMIQEQARKGTGETVNYEKALTSLRRSEAARQAQLNADNVKDRAAAQAKQQDLRAQILLTEQLALAEQNQALAQVAANQALATSNLATRQADNISDLTAGNIGLGAALAANSKNVNKYFDDLNDITPATTSFGKANNFLAKQFKKVGGALKLVVTFVSKYIFAIGAALVVAGALAAILDRIFRPQELKDYNAQVKVLEEILEGVAKKAEEYEKAIGGALPSAIGQQREFEILGNTIKEINDELIKSIELQDKFNKVRAGGPKEFGVERFADSSIIGAIQGVNIREMDGGSTFLPGIQRNAETFANEFKDQFAGIEEFVTATLGDVSETGSSELVRGVQNLSRIDESNEYKSLLEALTLKPYRDFLLDPKKSGIDFTKLQKSLTSAQLGEFLDDIAAGVDKAAKNFGQLSGVTVSFTNTLKEVEKSSSQFIQKFFPKTSVSVLLTNLKSMKTEIEAVGDASTILEGAANEEIGKLISQAGPQVRKLLGPAVDESISELARLEREFANMTEEEKNRKVRNPFGDSEITAGELKRLEVMGLQVKIGKEGAVTFEEALKTVTLIQQQEVLRKQTLAAIATEQKVFQTATSKFNVGLAQSLALDKQRFAIAQKERDTRLNFQAQEFEIETRITETGENRSLLISQLIAKRKELRDNNGDENKIAGISLVIAEQQNEVLKESIRLATEEGRLSEEDAKFKLKALEATEKIANAQATINRLAAEARARELGGTGALSPLEQVRLTTAEEEKKLEIAKTRLELEKQLASAQAAIVAAQLRVLGLQINILNADGSTNISAALEQERVMGLASAIEGQVEKVVGEGGALDEGFKALAAGFGLSLDKEFAKLFGKDSSITQGVNTTLAAAAGASSVDPENRAEQITVSLQIVRKTFEDFGNMMEEMFGENGKVIGALSNLVSVVAEMAIAIPESFAKINQEFNNPEGFFFEFKETDAGKTAQGLMKFAAVASAVSGILSGFQQVLAADAQRRTALIDDQIAQEKRMDGKSKESLAKIQAMEKKKEALERKQFERNKKLQIANALISTASAAAATYASISLIPGIGPFVAPGVAAGIIALGMAQVALIRKTQFSGGTGEAVAPNTALTIGSRGNAVDVSQTATGGELNYLRGGRTTGGDLGGAGGAMGRKGYADGGRGIVVGERGPEVITPSAPVDITPNFALGSGTSNVNFTINAIDSAGVEDVLTNQRGNIIRMIREAANENGERFLETIDTQTYGSSS
jgi:hypothetical protein